MSEPAARPPGDAAAALAVATARDALRRKETETSELVDETAAADPDARAALGAPGATFVTLKRAGRLRGCIGTLVAHRALGADIVHNTRRAMVDPRLAPVDASEWPELWISVSLLSEPEPLDVDGLDSLCAALRPGVDGLTLRQDLRRATFLPSVWESIDEPGKFVAQLLRKGGWEPGSWPAGMTAEIYHAHSHSSEPPRPPLGES